MEHAIAIAALIGIIAGIALIIWGGETARLRRALAYQAKQAADFRSENTMLHATIRIYETSIQRRDDEIHALKNGVAGAKSAGLREFAAAIRSHIPTMQNAGQALWSVVVDKIDEFAGRVESGSSVADAVEGG